MKGRKGLRPLYQSKTDPDGSAAIPTKTAVIAYLAAITLVKTHRVTRRALQPRSPNRLSCARLAPGLRLIEAVFDASDIET